MFYGAILHYGGWREPAFKRLLGAVNKILKRGPKADWKNLEDIHRAFAEILARPVCETWVEANGLKESRAHPCVRTLLEGRKSRECPLGCLLPPGHDHGRLWNKDGKPYCYTFQPYGPLDRQDLKNLIDFCDEHGLVFTVSGMSWHFVGRTLLVALIKKVP